MSSLSFSTALICRICECKTSHHDLNLDQNAGTMKKLRVCANISIGFNDELPKYLCQTCVDDLDHACKFKIRCESSDYKFRRCIEAGVTPEDNDEWTENRQDDDGDHDFCPMPDDFAIVISSNTTKPMGDSTDSIFTSNLTECSIGIDPSPVEHSVMKSDAPDDRNNDDTTCNEYDSFNSTAECSGQMESIDTSQQIANIANSDSDHSMNDNRAVTPLPKRSTRKTKSGRSTKLARTSKRIIGRKNGKISCSGCRSSTQLKLQDNNQCGKRPFKCDMCEKSYRLKYHLNRHKLSHYQPSHKCNICSKWFIRKDSFTNHSRMHMHLI